MMVPTTMLICMMPPAMTPGTAEPQQPPHAGRQPGPAQRQAHAGAGRSDQQHERTARCRRRATPQASDTPAAAVAVAQPADQQQRGDQARR